MDLSALLAREGIRPGDVETLLQWARQRASVLIARIEPGSQLAELLAGRERTQEPAAAALQPAARSVPLPIARSVSRPYLNAAVEAALSGKHDVQLALENAAPGGQALPERPVLEDIPEPAPEPAEDDPSIGGFNRFAFALRKRAPEPAPEPTPRTANLTRGFELHAESQGPRISWDDEQVPEPPGFEARLSESARMHIANLNEESSDGLVLGIPDDDGDIPVYRGRPRSQAIAAETSSSGLTDAAFDAMIEPSDLEPVTPELAPSGPHTTVGAPSASSDASDSGPITTASGPHAAARPSSGPVPAASGPHAAARPSSGPVPAASGPHAAARPSSGPVPAASGPHAAARPSSAPVPAASGPHAAARSGPVPAASGPQPAASQASSDPVPAASGAHAASGPAAAPASAPPPRPASAPTPASSAPPAHRRGKKTQPQPIVAVAKPTKPEPRHEGKKGKQRKKVVELSQPVARPVSAPSPAARPATLPPVSLTRPISAATPMATPTSSSPATPSSRGVPDYLRDDED